MQSTGNRLQELMDAHVPPMERYDVAALCKRDTSTVARWLSGGTMPDDVKRTLTEHFKVSVEHLLGWDRENADQLELKAEVAR